MHISFDIPLMVGKIFSKNPETQHVVGVYLEIRVS